MTIQPSDKRQHTNSQLHSSMPKSSFRLSRKLFLSLATLSCGLIFASHILGQGSDTPTGSAGSFGGSIATGGGSFDPYERNASRSVTDILVPGAVVPFTYTRIWNSRGGQRHNWSWSIYANESDQEGPGHPNDMFHGYFVSYPDGRVANFNKPSTPAHGGWGMPGTYTNAFGVLDRFVIDADGVHGHLFMSDGSVLNFDVAYNEVIPRVTSIADPRGRVVTFTYLAGGLPWDLRVTEPGGRWINIGGQVLSGNTSTVVVSTGFGNGELGPSVTYTDNYYTSGSWPEQPHTGPDTGLYADGVLTNEHWVTYENIPDPETGLPLKAHSVSKWVQPRKASTSPSEPEPNATYRLVWASDPMFEGPLQQIKYLYVDNCTGVTLSNGDNSRSAVLEERWAASSTNAGVMTSRVEMPPNPTWSYAGYSEVYYTREETRGDGATRTLSYFNPTTTFTYYNPPTGSTLQGVGRGQMFVDHFTDFTNNLNQTERHEYDWTNLFQTPIKITDARQKVTLQTLETILGHITQETHPDPDSSYLTWTYENAAQPNSRPYYVETTKDELLRTTTYTRDPVTHLVTRIDYPGGPFETFTYNSFGQVYDHQLASGTMEHFRYDARGLKTSEWNDAYPSEVTYYTYDNKDRVETVRNPRAVALGIPYSLKYEYNGRHQITKIHYPATGGSSDPTVTYGYDKWGRCTSITDELGHTRSMIYDDYGRCTSYTESLNAPNWNNTSTVASRTWNWTYERMRNGVTYAANTHMAKEWRTQVEPAFDKDGNRRMTVREYDLNNRLAIEQTGWIMQPNSTVYYSGDGETHSFEYDPNGNKSKYIDPLGRITTYEYDSRNRLTKTNETINTVPRITITDYDVTSNKTKVTFPDNTTQQWLNYDAFGQPAQFKDERLNITDLTYQWGPMKKLLAVTTHRDRDGGGTEDQLTTFSYDGMGRALRTTFPDTSYEESTYQYDQLRTWRVRKGAVKTISYDARSREILQTWNDSVTPRIGRIWDDANRVFALYNIHSTISYGYDDTGQILWEFDGPGQATAPNPLKLAALSVERPTLTYYRYTDGNVAHLKYPNGFVLRRDHTARGQLAAVGWDDNNGNWIQKAARYTYRADGKLNYERYGNGVETTFAYDGRGFVSGINTSKLLPIKVYSNRSYYRDTRDRIFAWKKSNTPANNPLENGRGDRYSYDNEGQLTAASYQALTPEATPSGAQRTEHFDYDQLGNRKGNQNLVSGHTGNVTFARRDNGLNQYESWSPPMAATNYENNGALVQDGNITAEYNALNQPRCMWSAAISTNTGSNWLWFGYDPLGRCVTRWSGPYSSGSPTPDGSKATSYYYEGWNLIQEGEEPEDAGQLYVHGNRVDEIVASRVGGLWYYHHYDARGHCILLTDAAGKLEEQYDYDAFGKPYFYDPTAQALNTSTIGNRFLFTGREWLSDLKVYDFRNRQYLPELGRFIQPDPKQFSAGDYNLYRYCHNDPVNRADPFGLIDLKLELIKTGDRNQHVPEIIGQNGNKLSGKTEAEFKVRPGEKQQDGSTKVTGEMKVNVKYADTAGPKTKAETARLEPEHAKPFDKFFDRAQKTVDALNRVKFDSAAAAEKAMEGSLRGKFREAEAESRRLDRPRWMGGEHQLPFRYDQ